MSIKIALAGNPNCGKTTLFNALTGSSQFVGNWPGVTVEKKEGKLKGYSDVFVVDLPGIYSLSPYTLEEIAARNYLITERPDVILNIVDGTNIERSLYLTTQLLELGIPVILAVNMMDIVNKNGDKIHIKQLSKVLGCNAAEISALKGSGIKETAERAVKLAESRQIRRFVHKFDKRIESVLKEIEQMLRSEIPEEQKRFYAVKLFERDEQILERMNTALEIETIIQGLETEMDDDSESIITNERYAYITSIIHSCYEGKNKNQLTASDKIDRIVTNRWMALPIFAIVMFIVYFISVTTVGGWAADWANDSLFGEGWHLFGIGFSAYEQAMEDYEAENIGEANIVVEEKGAEEPDPGDFGIWVPGILVLAEGGLDAVNCVGWLKSLILEGIIAGVGAVLGFVPQMLVLFIFLAFLEMCGYMARVAFIMDRIFRKFGLSGKSFIPILIGTGCGVPGIMASRTIENDRDRKMTIMTTTFIPCSAKLPIISLIAGALFGGVWWVAPSAYFIGIGAIIMSGIILKKTKLFAGDPAPFVMELPAYHWPMVGNILRSMWERSWSFIKKAGTIILLSAIFVWFTSNFGIVNGRFGRVEDLSDGFLAAIGKVISWIFIPLGWGNWQAAVAAIMGLVAKENVVGILGVLYGFAEATENNLGLWEALAGNFTAVAAYSFLVFNLLCAPCFAAIGAIKREMNSPKWTWFALGYQTGFAYVISLCIYQIGNLLTGREFTVFTAIAFFTVLMILYLLFRPYKKKDEFKAKRYISNQ